MIPTSLDWLHIEFMQKALAGSILVSVSCGLLGMFVVLRRIVFISMSLAEVSSAAVAFAFLVGFNPSITAIVITLIATFILAIATTRKTRFPPEALIAIIYMLASSTAILMIAKNPQGEVDLMNVLFGNILTVNDRQLFEALFISVPVIGILGLFFRYFIFTTFDFEMAAATGLRPRVWQSLFYLLLGLVIVIGIRISGALLTFAYLIIPPYVGLRLSRRIWGVVLASLLIGPIATFFGLWLSFAKDLPTGPSVTLVCVLLSLASIPLSHLRSRH